MAEKDFYEILGVPRDASDAQIKKAYRQLARKYHPDKAQGDPHASDRFKEVQQAYEVLSDPQKRQNYDRFGPVGVNMGEGPWPAAEGTGRTYRYTTKGPGRINFDFSEIFGSGGGDFGFDFSEIFGNAAATDKFRRGRQSPQQQAPPRGKDIEHSVKVSFEEAIYGTTRDVVATISQARGTQHKERITVKIPAGVENGRKIRVRGKGQPGPEGNDGDLIISVEVQEHRYFKRDGANIYLEVPITYTEAALGAKIDVPTLSGTTTVTIPPGSSSGRKLRLKGKGIKTPTRGNVGDMYLILKIVPPTDPDDETRQILRDLAQKRPQDDIRRDWH